MPITPLDFYVDGWAPFKFCVEHEIVRTWDVPYDPGMFYELTCRHQGKISMHEIVRSSKSELHALLTSPKICAACTKERLRQMLSLARENGGPYELEQE